MFDARVWLAVVAYSDSHIDLRYQEESFVDLTRFVLSTAQFKENCGVIDRCRAMSTL